MSKNIYIGNLSYGTTEESLQNYFSAYGTVVSVKLITERDSGKSKGFGFVEMGTDEEAKATIEATDGKEFEGRKLRVNEAMDRPPPRRDNRRY